MFFSEQEKSFIELKVLNLFTVLYLNISLPILTLGEWHGLNWCWIQSIYSWIIRKCEGWIVPLPESWGSALFEIFPKRVIWSLHGIFCSNYIISYLIRIHCVIHPGYHPWDTLGCIHLGPPDKTALDQKPPEKLNPGHLLNSMPKDDESFLIYPTLFIR